MKRYIILTGLLLHALLSFSQEDSWDVYMAQYEKGVGSTLVNMSLKEMAPIKLLPYLLSTGVKLKNCTAEGLPMQDEFEILYKISDTIKLAIDSKSKNNLVGTFSYLCKRKDFYYLDDTTGIRAFLELCYKKYFPNYEYSIDIKKDEDWKAYLEFLYPNEDTYEYMSNDKVLRNLTKEGDDLTKPRQVDHWLYFKTDTERNNFISYAEINKFKIESKAFKKDLELKYQLQISRIDNVDIASISKITIVLKRKAKELNGKYDGWETFVIKK